MHKPKVLVAVLTGQSKKWMSPRRHPLFPLKMLRRRLAYTAPREGEGVMSTDCTLLH
jgi:hypothetical protein